MRTLDEKEIKLLEKMLTKNKARGIEHLRAAIYARKSAEDEKETSLSTQIDHCKEVISKYEFIQLVKIFSEDNVSGMFTDGRKEYKHMMEMAEEQKIDVIIVMKLDRLARDLADSSTAVKLLKSYGCHLIAGDDVSNPNTPSGEFLRSIMFAQAQFHARRVASDVMASECKNAKDGKNAGGIAPYGLKLVNQRFEIDENEAPAVKIIFERYISGKSYKKIIDELSQLGYKTRNGNKFSYSTINDMLKNDKYYGTYVYNREGSKRRKNRVVNEEFDEVRNANAIKPIIEKSLFDKASELIKSRQNCAPRQNSNPSFVLTGKIICKNCGKSMCGESQTGGRSKKKRRIYQCPNHTTRKDNVCSTKEINADYLENAVKELIINSINDYMTSSNLESILSPTKKQIEEYVAIISRHISDTDNKAKKFLERAVSSTSQILAKKYESQAEEYLTSAEEYKSTLAKYRNQLANITKCTYNKTQFSVEEVFASYDTFRALVSIFIKEIVIDDANDEVNIEFNA